MAKNASKRKISSASKTASNRAEEAARTTVSAARKLTMAVIDGSKPARAVETAASANRAAGRKRTPKSPSAGASRGLAKAMQVAPIGLQADVTPKLTAAAPVFGDVLRAIGHAVAVTQTALDEAALESLKTLAAQKVDVPVLVVQTLTEDGVPDTVEIKTASVPLTSIITPSMQMVEQMTLRMDMRVQSFDATSGIRFNQNVASAGISYSNHSFGFAVGMSNTNVNAQFSNMSDFSSGSVMMSMDIVDRTGFQIPKPMEYGIGANLLVRLEIITQTAVDNSDPTLGFNRVARLNVKRVKPDGSVIKLEPSEYDTSLPPGLLPDTSVTGILKITRVCATAVEPYLERKIYVTLGQLTKEVTLFI